MQAVLWHTAIIFYRALCQYADGMEKIEAKALASEAEKFIVRLPGGMRERIAEAAKTNNRSMNAEVVARLQASFEAQNVSPPLEEFVEILAEKLATKLKGP